MFFFVNFHHNILRESSIAKSESLMVETELKTQVEEIWRVNQTKEKFIELDDMMARVSNSLNSILT